MSSKMRIKVGQIEVDYEGTEEFLKKDLPALLLSVSKLFSGEAGKPNLATAEVHLDQHLSAKTIASKLGVKSGSELVMAACAHLSLVKKQATFGRKAILDEMKGATGFYKSTYGSNLTKYIDSLLKSDDLTETGTDAYTISDKKAREIAAKIG
jgi:hypothetical protein